LGLIKQSQLGDSFKQLSSI